MPMVMEYEYNENGSMERISFEGLNGTENAGNLKCTLGLLKIENPAVTFAEKVKAGEYDHVPDDEFIRIRDETKFVSSLWHYPDDREGQTAECEMNALMLLANSIEAASRLHAAISGQDTGDNDWDSGKEITEVWRKSKR